MKIAMKIGLTVLLAAVVGNAMARNRHPGPCADQNATVDALPLESVI